MATEFDDLDSFLNHSSRSKNTDFLDWKKEGKLVAWLHTRQKPIAVWAHSFPRIVIKKGDDDEEKRNVFFSKYNCHESEDVLKMQYLRHKAILEGKEVKSPLEKCGMCRFIDWVLKQVHSGALSWTKPIFKFEHEDPTKSIVIHAGGIYNGFKGELTKEQKKELSEAGISPKRAWGENGMAKCEYLLTLVDNDHPDKGVRISRETSSLGDKVKDVIADRLEALGREKGNPFVNPYAIKFMFNKEADKPQDMYKARPLEGIVITPQIKDLITGDPPDLEKQITPFNQKEMRAYLEGHCLIKNVPWDELFKDSGGESKSNGKSESKSNGKSDEESSDADESDSGSSDESSDDDMVFACDKCGEPMKATDTKCANCGAEYEVEGEEEKKPEPPPPPPMKKRSDMKKKVPF